MNVHRHYAAWNFYMSLYDEPECDEGFSPVRAKEFIDNYHDHYGNDTLVTDPMESAYVGVRFFSFLRGLAAACGARGGTRPSFRALLDSRGASVTAWKRRPEIHLWSRAVQAAGTFDIDVPRPLPLHLRGLGVTRMSVVS